MIQTFFTATGYQVIGAFWIKLAYLDAEDIDLIKSFPRAMDPDLYFFRHMTTKSGVGIGEQFGPEYFKKWWDKACDNLGIKGVDLYGGTKHSTATALGEFLTPEQIKRGGTGSATNKAFKDIFSPAEQNLPKLCLQSRSFKKSKQAKLSKCTNKKSCQTEQHLNNFLEPNKFYKYLNLLLKNGGGGGSRTRVRKYSTMVSTYLA